jgi:hypothetical protein
MQPQSYVEMKKASPELAASLKSLNEVEAMKRATSELEHVAINFEEFKSWYFNSLFWTERKAELSEAADVAEGHGFSFSNSLEEQIKYVFLWPLLATLENTLCDPHQPGKES